jgi:hypothetical protein
MGTRSEVRVSGREMQLLFALGKPNRQIETVRRIDNHLWNP